MAKEFSHPQPAAAGKKTERPPYSSWIEIDLDALDANLRQIQKHTEAQICPVLKGDAYGHGAPVISAFLKSRGLSLVAAGDVEEALPIASQVRVRIMLLTPPLPEQLPAVFRYNLIPTVTEPSLIRQLGVLAAKTKQPLALQIKVDTGLGRLGVRPEGALNLAELIKKNPYLHLEGVFTHFARSRPSARKQLQRLLNLKTQFQAGGFSNLLWHAAASAPFLSYPASHLDLVRLGTVLFGETPLPLDQSWQLATTWRLRTRLIQVRHLPPGHSIGYGPTLPALRPKLVGVIPIGYGDGLEMTPQAEPWRQIKQLIRASWKGRPENVFYKGRPAPIFGQNRHGPDLPGFNGLPRGQNRR